MINRVQKKAVLGEQFSALNLGADTFGGFSGAIDANVQLSDRIAGRLNAYVQELESHRDFYDGTSYAVNPTLTFELSDRTRATLAYEYVDDDRVVDRGVPSQNVDGGPDVPLRGFDDTFFGDRDANFTTCTSSLGYRF